ncbi:hypothetical protein VOI54_03185 [Tamlana sp. 2201CG12-4]|uniref:hypothetical protein n=1 Tax=Tamlana sp. 2201CG12-4 TaxID=3112582 RepID=UPI002DBFAB22|nr:hypothetical protein [Tamlana sp. 2201CG12-4]MEC3906004.1 hypothetical protein [Tamlana sp. 2201CG12-4]
MHSTLLIKAFEKAKKEEQKKGIKDPSNYSLAKIISAFISNKKTAIGERRLGDYYKQALKDNTKDINISQSGVIHGLCNYLGYENYEDFIKKSKTHTTKNEKSWLSLIVTLIAVFILVLGWFGKAIVARR